MRIMSEPESPPRSGNVQRATCVLLSVGPQGTTTAERSQGVVRLHVTVLRTVNYSLGCGV